MREMRRQRQCQGPQALTTLSMHRVRIVIPMTMPMGNHLLTDSRMSVRRGARWGSSSSFQMGAGTTDGTRGAESGQHAVDLVRAPCRQGPIWILNRPDSSAYDFDASSDRCRPPAVGAGVALEKRYGAAQRVSVIDARVVPGVVVFARLWLRGEAGCNEARVRLWTTAPARLDEYVSVALSPTTTSLGPSDALTNPVASIVVYRSAGRARS